MSSNNQDGGVFFLVVFFAFLYELWDAISDWIVDRLLGPDPRRAPSTPQWDDPRNYYPDNPPQPHDYSDVDDDCGL